MYELTLEEINFLRWLLDRNQSASSELDVEIKVLLSDYQAELLASIQNKLKWLSSY